MKQQRGFTLIELIVVIVILGILAATALPKFSNLTADARAAKMNAIMAAMQDATIMVHGQYQAENVVSNASVVGPDNATIALFNGYPSTSGIAAALNVDLTGATVQSNVSAATAGGSIAFWFDAAHPDCAVTYDLTATSLYNAPVINNASIVPALIAASCLPKLA